MSNERPCRQTGAGMQERPANATGAFRVAGRTTGAKASIPGPVVMAVVEMERAPCRGHFRHTKREASRLVWVRRRGVPRGELNENSKGTKKKFAVKVRPG